MQPIYRMLEPNGPLDHLVYLLHFNVEILELNLLKEDYFSYRWQSKVCLQILWFLILYTYLCILLFLLTLKTPWDKREDFITFVLYVKKLMVKDAKWTVLCVHSTGIAAFSSTGRKTPWAKENWSF
jgi:hypothetical protein